MTPNYPCSFTIPAIMLIPFAGALLVRILPPGLSIRAGLLFLLAQFAFFPGLASCVFGCGGPAGDASYTAVFKVMGLLFRCDIISLVFAGTSVLTGVLIYLFSLGYFMGEKEAEKEKFSFWGLVFVGSMMGVVFSDNLVSLYFFWELAGLCSWRLIGFYRKEEDLRNADKAFLITSAGAGMMMLGFAMIYLQSGSLSLSALHNTWVSPLVFTLFFLGVLTKSASFPFHTWLPDASVAPTPVTAFLHAAVLVKIGIYGLFRLFGATLLVTSDVSWAGWLALLSSLVAGAVALRQTDIKRILAFSTVSQLGFMIAGITVFNSFASRGVILFYVAHALGKGCLFLCAGIAEKIYSTRDIREMGGLMKRSPWLTFAFLVGMLSVAGIPPLPGFFGKLWVIAGMLFERRIFFAFFAILTTVLTLLYLFRLFSHVFMGESNGSVRMEKSCSGQMIFPVVIMSAISVLLGLVFLMNETVAWN